MNAARIVKIAKALADPTRYKMLRAIRTAGELNCSQVCEKFPLSQPTISHHVRTLEEAGLISIRRKGQYHILAIRSEALGEFAMGLTGPAEAGGAGSSRKRRSRPRVGNRTGLVLLDQPARLRPLSRR
ncbi:MAG: helix-turn-helix transcriptional regulator [Phycisphaerales bacterium]|nr:helix-turn-helix transcriptional regulator [Phycisphaerales bacterium]